MRGAVYHYDEDQDYGYINGIDGKRYIFARSDLGHGVALVRGTLVEFQPDDGTAHNIVAAASTTPSSRTVSQRGLAVLPKTCLPVQQDWGPTSGAR
jgi:hypothetical protein